MSTYGLPEDNDRLDIYPDVKGEWRWRLQAANGRVIADSGEGYESAYGAERAASRVFPTRPAPEQIITLPGWALWSLIVAALIGFLIGLMVGSYLSEGEVADPLPTTTTIPAETTFPSSPSGDPLPNTSTTEAP